jgi:methylenetetrahydrofolate--tRNA-(uracil-5-)-methyltransferase
MRAQVTVVGGGLAGSEAAWQAAEAGCRVRLFEMRPTVSTGAHQTSDLGELICSNSLGSQIEDRATGVLLAELERMGSLLIKIARRCALPAGGALAVDRSVFSSAVTAAVTSHPEIELERSEVKDIPDGEVVIVASGPLTSASLAESIAGLTGGRALYFYDAISPIVAAESIDMQIAFRGSRYRRGESESGDYINCPLDAAQYRMFNEALAKAERISLKAFEDEIDQGVNSGNGPFFEGCLPVEVLAARGEMSLAYGPMRPVGLRDPRTGRRPFAAVQLRQDDLAATLYNLVGFQTNLTFGEQRRVLRMIPGLQNAKFVRYGQMHRNTFINSPRLLLPSLQFLRRPGLLFAGQITGVEGYMGNIATGLLAGINAARIVHGQDPWRLPPDTMLGALCRYITSTSPETFQPMKANFGLLPALPDSIHRKGKKGRAKAYSERALASIDSFMANQFSH